MISKINYNNKDKYNHFYIGNNSGKKIEMIRMHVVHLHSTNTNDNLNNVPVIATFDGFTSLKLLSG